MDIQAEKLDVIQWLAGVNDTAIIKKFISLKRSNQQSTLSVEEKSAIDAGLEDIREGRTKSHEEVMAITRKKYPHLTR